MADLPVNDGNAATIPAAVQAEPQKIILTLDNAPLLAAKFLEGIHQELKLIRELLEKQSG